MSATPHYAARPHLADLVEELKAKGAIRSEPWAEAFATVPRHVFVPRWYEQETNDRGITVWRLQHSIHEDRLPQVYRDTTLVTALDPNTAEQVDTNAWTGFPTSSSTLPSLMAGMLEDLTIEDGHRVLEIGTGTGYNAALLCARLGDGLVHSIDIDRALIATARERLAQINYRPQIIDGDGRDCFPTGIEYDRIIATCSVPHIPPAWIDRTRPDGIILTDLDLGIEGGLVRLSVDADHRAFGHFTASGGRFMPARSEATAYPRRDRAPLAPETATRATTVTAADIRSNYPFRLLLALELRDAELVYHSADDGTMSIQLQQPDGSWARTPFVGDATVTHGGLPGLWQKAEAAWAWWNEHGRPSQDRFGYAREPWGTARAWHIPTGRHWDL
ncbi:methyltransferase domain-containing protein [Streptomyces sp. NPDC048416]|uniref:methyltransferase domain-containing protein n=1 Tax=Streptomyces sp. NPDC048416 TaxID=3365546 RepID=UPI00371440A3